MWKSGLLAGGSSSGAKEDESSVQGPDYNSAVAITVREFKPEDFEALWRMDQECFVPEIAYTKRELGSFIRYRGAFTLVACEGDKINGFIVAQTGNVGHVITIDVSPQARRTGTGSLLLAAAEKRLASNGSRAVGLETAVDNLGALSFYKRHGYSVVRTWPRYYANGLDALVLSKDLVKEKVQVVRGGENRGVRNHSSN